MIYRIEIWRYHRLTATYENDDVAEVLKWYKDNWEYCYDCGGCTYELYKDGICLSFDEGYDLGFH